MSLLALAYMGGLSRPVGTFRYVVVCLAECTARASTTSTAHACLAHIYFGPLHDALSLFLPSSLSLSCQAIAALVSLFFRPGLADVVLAGVPSPPTPMRSLAQHV